MSNTNFILHSRLEFVHTGKNNDFSTLFNTRSTYIKQLRSNFNMVSSFKSNKVTIVIQKLTADDRTVTDRKDKP
jgi:hypothetical protein